MGIDKYINKIIQGDCLEVMKEFPDKSVDLVLTDPPYGITNEKWDKIPSKKYFNEILRISKEQIIFGGNYFANKLPITKNWIVWDKTIKGKTFLKNRSEFELIWLSIKIQPYIINYTVDGNIEGWDGGKPQYKNRISSYHPTQKPVAFIKSLLNNYSQENDLILDCFAGSGTTLVACKQLNRKYIGIEKKPKYVEICKQRLAQGVIWEEIK